MNSFCAMQFDLHGEINYAAQMAHNAPQKQTYAHTHTGCLWQVAGEGAASASPEALFHGGWSGTKARRAPAKDGQRRGTGGPVRHTVIIFVLTLYFQRASRASQKHGRKRSKKRRREGV